MELTNTSSTSKSRGPSNERKSVAAAEKQLESMVYRLTQERGRWPLLTPRLENATEKTREDAPPLVKQIWDFLEVQLEVAERREMTVARFVTAANEVTIGGFWREHARGELRTRRDHEILEFLSPCWGKEFMAGVYSAKETIFGAFISVCCWHCTWFTRGTCSIWAQRTCSVGAWTHSGLTGIWHWCF